jgi:hypothetical protein
MHDIRLFHFSAVSAAEDSLALMDSRADVCMVGCTNGRVETNFVAGNKAILVVANSYVARERFHGAADARQS